MSTAWPPLLEPVPPSQGRVLTLEDWLDLDEDEAGELVGNRLVEEEVPDAVHELAFSWLVAFFRSWLGSSGFVFGSELKLAMGLETGRKPDVVVYLPGTPGPQRRGAVSLPPDIVVEVITSSPRDERRDRVEKMAEYARFGVRYCWLVDPALGTVEIFERTTAGRYEKLVGVTTGKIEALPGDPALFLDGDALWAELSRLPAQ